MDTFWIRGVKFGYVMDTRILDTFWIHYRNVLDTYDFAYALDTIFIALITHRRQTQQTSNGGPRWQYFRRSWLRLIRVPSFKPSTNTIGLRLDYDLCKPVLLLETCLFRSMLQILIRVIFVSRISKGEARFHGGCAGHQHEVRVCKLKLLVPRTHFRERYS